MPRTSFRQGDGLFTRLPIGIFFGFIRSFPCPFPLDACPPVLVYRPWFLRHDGRHHTGPVSFTARCVTKGARRRNNHDDHSLADGQDAAVRQAQALNTLHSPRSSD